MGMGLATACGPRVLRGICVPLFITAALAPLGGVARVTVCMARHLLFCERCGPDSAGNTWSWSRSPATAAGSGRPHDVRKGIIRRQAVGFPRYSRERVGMRLAVASSRHSTRFHDGGTAFPSVKSIPGIGITCKTNLMSVTGQLRLRERRGAHSAGQIF